MPMPPPEPPAPLTPAQARARRAQHQALLASSRAQHQVPLVSQVAPGHPLVGARRFALEDLHRVAVTLSPAARREVAMGSREGRLLPQALAEAFGAVADVVHITLDLVPKRTHFPLLVEEEAAALATGAEPWLLEVVVEHATSAPHRWLLNAAHLSDLDERTHLPTMSAAAAAAGLAQEYAAQQARDAPPLAALAVVAVEEEE